MKKHLLIAVLAVLPLCLLQAKDDKSEGKEKSSVHVFTGISGGIMAHGGYLFAQSPDVLFSNTGLGDPATWGNLKKDGFCYGFGAQLRIHLINHIHVGGEAHLSNMPLMKTGSNVNSAWAGGFVDFFGGWGKAKAMIGLGIGGGQLKRLFVPEGEVEKVPEGEGNTSYNSAYTKTPFFYLDPYIGIEFPLIGNVLGMQFKIDYMLPFGNPNSNLAENVKWSNFLSPSGPRLHVALLFGQLSRK